MRLPVLRQLLPYRQALIIGVHILLIPLGYLAAFQLRFDFETPANQLRRFWETLPFLLGLRLACLYRFGLYRGYWRHVGLPDLVDLVAAVTLSSLLFITALVFLGQLKGMPRSVVLLDWLIMIFLSGGIRFAARWAREGQPYFRPARGKRTLIIGAGEAGEQLLRQVLHDQRGPSLNVVGFLDDDATKRGRALHGVPILGRSDDLPRLVEHHQIAMLVIAIPSASGEQMRRIVARCERTNIALKILPPLQDLLNGAAAISQLRDVQIEDLLGREPVRLSLDQVERDLAGKAVLITGGAGSIGSELAHQIARFHPARLILLDRAESPLYFVHVELSRAYPDLDVIPVIASVTNQERLEQVFKSHSPDYVFHAAAYKHVPMLEANVIEAAWNNVVGTLRAAECAARHGATKFVLISTDKAVNPTSILGATKRIAERIVLELPSLRASGTDFRAVRFGNVLGSDGSVVPLFKRQLANGGPLTVTHPDVKRYFMTIPEAVQLVLQAAALPEAAGRISMLEMGTPIRIITLAEQLIRLSGLEPYRDVRIVFTGLRPGEKLDEELVSATEATLPTSFEKIRVVQPNGVYRAPIGRQLLQVIGAMTHGDQESLMREIAAVVPEYVPWRSIPAPRRPTPAPRPAPGGAVRTPPNPLARQPAAAREV